jgi:Glyoxalase-like domain
VQLDHVLVAVADLEAAVPALAERHGLEAVAGGRHPGWGTANAIVPLGGTYLELITVTDEDEAAGSLVGGWVARTRSPAGTPLGWAIRTDEIDAVAHRLDLDVTPGSRATRDGHVLRWRLAGLAAAAAEPALPFFIEWEDGTPFPGQMEARHAAGAARLARVELRGDPDRLATWLGGHELPVTISPGEPAVSRIVLSTDAGELVLGT